MVADIINNNNKNRLKKIENWKEENDHGKFDILIFLFHCLSGLQSVSYCHHTLVTMFLFQSIQFPSIKFIRLGSNVLLLQDRAQGNLGYFLYL